VDICPDVFKKNMETGLIEVIDLAQYPEEELMEAISMCPADCITLEEGH
jgi:ferredoxin